jgi:hypothetical protein
MIECRRGISLFSARGRWPSGRVRAWLWAMLSCRGFVLNGHPQRANRSRSTASCARGRPRDRRRRRTRRGGRHGNAPRTRLRQIAVIGGGETGALRSAGANGDGSDDAELDRPAVDLCPEEAHSWRSSEGRTSPNLLSRSGGGEKSRSSTPSEKTAQS